MFQRMNYYVGSAEGGNKSGDRPTWILTRPWPRVKNRGQSPTIGLTSEIPSQKFLQKRNFDPMSQTQIKDYFIDAFSKCVRIKNLHYCICVKFWPRILIVMFLFLSWVTIWRSKSMTGRLSLHTEPHSSSESRRFGCQTGFIWKSINYWPLPKQTGQKHKLMKPTISR